MSVPNVCTIAGSDPSGGAGIQADLKTFSALGAYGCAVITSLTAQSTRGVTAVHDVPAAFVREQVTTLIADVRLDAVKIGMLSTVDIIESVDDLLRSMINAPVVLDPVMVATSGAVLMQSDALAAMRALVPSADLVTPNTHEAGVLLGVPPAQDVPELERQALLLRDELGARRVLLKGGHLSGGDAIDVLVEGAEVTRLTSPRMPTSNTHGTGCSLSSAIAALVPQRTSWKDAVSDAKVWLTGALAHADELTVGHGAGPVHHFYQLWSGHGRNTR